MTQVEKENYEFVINQQREALLACKRLLEALDYPESQGTLLKVNNALELK